MSYLHVATELVIGFILLFCMTKLLGKTHIQQITPFDFISTLVLGELLGNAIYDQEVDIVDIFFAIVVWTALMYLIELLELKSLFFRGILNGKPSIVIYQGSIDKKMMKKCKISMDQLKDLLRQKNVFSIHEVEYAVLESNGALSVMKKKPYRSAEKQDIQTIQRTDSESLPLAVIVEGKVLKDDLLKRGLSEEWLVKELKNKGYVDTSQVFYAEWTPSDGLYVVQ